MTRVPPGPPRTPINCREHHVVTLRWQGGHVKLFRLQFHGPALFVNFPYQPDAQGLYARCLVAPGGNATIDVGSEGRTTSRKIKYSHPVDGSCHFSQDAQIVTSIRNAGPRLDDGASHLFSVDILGHRRFAPLERSRRGEAYATFAFPDVEPAEQLHIVGRWMPFRDDVSRYSNPLEVEVPVPGGYRGVFLACAPPPGSPLDGHLLLLEVYSVDPVVADVEFLLLFIGGFGADLADSSVSSDFLFLQYPVVGIPDVATADFIRDLAPRGLS